MSHILTKLEKSQAEFVITVPPTDYRQDMETAAARLSERAAIKGFRPGKAPYDIVKEQLGELKILEEAARTIVEKNFFAALKTEGLETIGAPEITLEKMAPGNDFIFKAKVALLPKVKLAALNKIKVERKKIEVTGAQADAVLHDLRKMQPKETLKTGAAGPDDKIVVDMDMFIDRVPVEGGQSKGYQIYLNEPHYIPGMAEQLLGLKKDDVKEFRLKFPPEHYQKHLAGKDVDFKVKVKDIFEVVLPETDDAFAKTLGQESLTKLKELLLANLTREAEQKEDQRLEIAILEQLIERSEFDEIPEVLTNSEKQKMFQELKHDLEHRGISFEQYLTDLKKTEEQIRADFTEGAVKRAKAALISRQLATENNLRVEKEEMDKEIGLIKEMYKNDPKVEENLKRPEVLDTIAATVLNRKVMGWVKSKIVNNQ